MRGTRLTVACGVLLLWAGSVCAQFGRPASVVRPGGSVGLPYTVNDNTGNQWMIYQGGQFQQQGNMPVYSQGAQLQISGGYVQARGNTGRVDEKTGELILENMTGTNVTVTRRILINKEEGWLRYIDIIKNSQNQDQTVNLMYSTNTNYGVQSSAMVADPKHKDAGNIAWVAQTNANGRTVVEMFAGKGAKHIPTIAYQPNNNAVQIGYSASIPAGKEIALMHFHYTTSTVDAGQKFVLGMKESKVMASLPAAIRRLIVNFRGGESFIGDYEILRGDILDVVELRGGDQLKGTLQEKSYKLQTFYGNVELPVENVIGLINAGEFRPRQLLVTKDGEIFGGQLGQPSLALKLSSGQVTQIPLSQVSRMGYRKRGDEPEEWTFDKPMVLMRSGDRIAVQVPAADLQIATRYGMLTLKPEAIAAISFQNEDSGVHQVFLTDGSHFAGLVSGELFEMKLAGEGPEQVVKFPAASVRRLQFGAHGDGIDAAEPSLRLANEDLLVGELAGTLKLDTAFNTLELNAGEIKRLTHAPTSPADVQVILWDETSVSGQLQDQVLTCQLKSGVTMKVPVVLLEEYAQPRPQPSSTVVETIKKLVVELNADDWKQRDAAQEKLVSMGIVVSGTLKQMRAAQTPEAQQRIDLILKQVEKEAEKPAAASGAVAPMPLPVEEFWLNKE